MLVGGATAAGAAPRPTPAELPEAASYVPGELVVGAENGPDRVVELEPGQDLADAIDQLERRPGVEYAVPNWIARAALAPLDVGSVLTPGGWAQDQWSFLERPGGIRVRRAWDRLAAAGHAGGRGATVAVVDTGVAYTDSPPYQAAPDFGRFVAPQDFVDGDSEPLDSNGHGTHVAATIGEQITLG